MKLVILNLLYDIIDIVDQDKIEVWVLIAYTTSHDFSKCVCDNNNLIGTFHIF
jgi:hypothetical protein